MRTGSSGPESGGGAQSDEGSSELLPASSLPGPPRGGNRHTASLVLVTPLGPQDPRPSALHPYGDTTLSGHHFPTEWLMPLDSSAPRRLFPRHGQDLISRKTMVPLYRPQDSSQFCSLEEAPVLFGGTTLSVFKPSARPPSFVSLTPPQPSPFPVLTWQMPLPNATPPLPVWGGRTH